MSNIQLPGHSVTSNTGSLQLPDTLYDGSTDVGAKQKVWVPTRKVLDRTKDGPVTSVNKMAVDATRFPGLVWAVAPGLQLADYVSGATLFTPIAPTIGSSLARSSSGFKEGISLRHASILPNLSDNYNPITTSGSITVLVIGNSLENGYSRNLFRRGRDAGAGAGWSVYLAHNAAQTYSFGIVTTSPSTVGYTATSTTTVQNTSQEKNLPVVVGRYSPGTAAIFVNGVQEHSVGTGTNLRTSTVGIGIASTTSNYDTNQGSTHPYSFVELVLVWNRALSDDEIRAISRNPWQIFAPRKQQIPVFQVPSKYAPGRRLLAAPGFSPGRSRLTYPGAVQAIVMSPQPTYIGSLNDNAGVSTLRAVSNIYELTRSGSGYNGRDIGLTIKTNQNFTILTVSQVQTQTSEVGNAVLGQTNTGISASIKGSDGTTAGKITGQIYLSGTKNIVGSVTLPVGSVYVGVLRQKYAVEQSLWVNGIKDANTGAYTGTIIDSKFFGIYDGRLNYSALHVLFNRALEDGEIVALSQNPWQIFKSINYLTIYSVVTALNQYQAKIYRSGVWTSVPIKRYNGTQWVSIVARPSV